MRLIKSYIFAAAAISLLASSCTKGFDELGKNPNAISKPTPDLLINSSVRGAINFYGGDFNRVVMFNYTQHFVAFQGRFQRYSTDINPLNNYWRDNYTACLIPVQELIRIYGDDPAYNNRVMIARIWKCYIQSQVAAIWGPIPYEKGLDGKIVVPYNREQDIYYMLLDDLKKYADAITLDGDYFTVDPVMGTKLSEKIIRGSHLVRWKKFAYTLRLRLAMRISNPAPNGDPVKAQEVVEDVFANEAFTMTDLDDTAKSNWGGVISTQGGDINPLYMQAVYNKISNIGTLPAFGETAHYHMAPYGDPRLPVYAQKVVDKKNDNTVPVHAGEYFGDTGSYGGYGGESGLAAPGENIHRSLTREDYSPIGSRFLAPDAEFIFLSTAECNFLKAEAKLKGWGGASAKTAEQYYYSGIRASMNHYAILGTEIDAYLDTPGIKWGTATKITDDNGADISAQFMDWLHICNSIVGQNDFLRQVIMQHWLAIPNQGVDAWTLMRRTQVLQFEPCFSPYEGTYKYLPYRLPYPVNELQYNGPEVNKAIDQYLIPRGIFKGNDQYVKLWFALPNKPIAGIPNPTDYL